MRVIQSWSGAVPVASGVRLLVYLWSAVLALIVLSYMLAGLSDALFGVVLLVLAMPMTLLLFWRRKQRRSGWLDYYVFEMSPWSVRLRGGICMLAGRFLSVLPLVFLLAVGLARVEGMAFWLILTGLMPFWIILHRWMAGCLGRHIHPRFHMLVTDSFQGAVFVVILLVLLSAWAMYSPVPDLRSLRLEQAIRLFASTPVVESDALQAGLVIAGALGAVPQWLIQNYGQLLPGLVWQLFAWSMVLLREWLFVMPLVLLLRSVHGLVQGQLPEPVKGVRDDRK